MTTRLMEYPDLNLKHYSPEFTAQKKRKNHKNHKKQKRAVTLAQTGTHTARAKVGWFRTRTAKGPLAS